jgi:hypothetical protein
MNMKILLVAACFLLLAVMMFAPPLSCVVKARLWAVMSTIQYRYFSSQDALFTALLTPDSQGGVDSMQWPLTHSEYTTVFNNTGIIVEPLSESGEDEIAFNNNYTDGVQMDRRSPMNYTDFRNALNCLVDKAGVIAGPILGGFATECDTQVPDPLMSDYINRAVTGANYPWKFNVTHALQILYNGGWYNHAIYPTLADLITAYGGGTGPLSTAGGTDHGVVYSGNDPNGQWGGGDPKATANAALGNKPLANLIGYVRSNDARKDLGDFFTTELKAIGCPVTENYKVTLTAIKPYVLAAQLYDFATLGYTMGVPPSWLYTELTPAGIYANGPNPYLVQDANTTKYAYAMFTDPTPAMFLADCLTVQYNLVWESYLVAGFNPASYCAYKTGLLGQFDVIGYGTQANGFQAENWITMNSRKTNTINYTGYSANAPESNILYIGLYNPPDMLNPIFQDTVFDFQITDEMFTYPLASNPYTIAVGSALTGNPTGSDLPWMAYAWKTELINDPYNASNPQWTNVTFWFRNDITWQNTVPFTTDDINYTIYINSFYGDAYDNAAMIFAANVSQLGTPDARYSATPGDPNYAAPYFQKDITPSDPTGSYTCSILVTSPSWLNLYIPNYEVVPYHIYKYIVPNNFTDAETAVSTDGLHGLWPGQAAVEGNILPGAPFNVSDIQDEPTDTLIGTGPFECRPDTTTASSFAPGGGITLDAQTKTDEKDEVEDYKYDDPFSLDDPFNFFWFWCSFAPGAMALKPTWINTSPSQQPSGVYFKIGLADLVLLSNAYGTTGTSPSTVSITSVPGAPHTWNPACDVAAPSGSIGLSDLVTLSLHYGWYYGNYSYNAPYPLSEIANGGP